MMNEKLEIYWLYHGGSFNNPWYHWHNCCYDNSSVNKKLSGESFGSWAEKVLCKSFKCIFDDKGFLGCFKS